MIFISANHYNRQKIQKLLNCDEKLQQEVISVTSHVVALFAGFGLVDASDQSQQEVHDGRRPDVLEQNRLEVLF